MGLAPWRKVLYAAGSIGVALSYQTFSAYIQFFYIDILGLKAHLVGLGWSLYGLWNAVNDPLSGYLSDNTRTRWGRRRPWIAGTCIPLGLFFYLLWVPPAALTATGGTPLFVYFIVVVLIFDLLWTLSAMNWTSLLPEMIPEEQERTFVSALREFFSIVGLMGVALVPFLVGPDWARRPSMAAAFAAVTCGVLILSVIGSREDLTVQQEHQPPLIPAIRATFRSLAFRWFLVASLHKEFIFIMLAAMMPFYAKYALRIQGPATVFGTTLDVGTQNSLLLGLAFLLALPGLWIWTVVAKRAGARRAWQAAHGLFAVAMVFVFLADDFVEGAMATALAGIGLAGLLMLPIVLLSDVIDEDETVTGARREGVFFGINGLVIRLAFTMQGVTTGLVLSLTGYISSTAANLYPAQPANAVLGIRALTAGVPMVACLVAIWALQHYPLHNQRLAEVRRATEALRRGRADTAGQARSAAGS